MASLVVGKPRIHRDHSDIGKNCWEAHEARDFLTAAKSARERPAAFYSLALDSGARKGELCGLKWGDLDFEKGTVTFVRQLIETDEDGAPVYGPIKNDMPRTVDLSAETITLLKDHKRHQAKLKDGEPDDLQGSRPCVRQGMGERYHRKDFLGLPLQANNMGEREFARIIKAANVKRISIHGLRHTSATLLLKAGVAPHVVHNAWGISGSR